MQKTRLFPQQLLFAFYFTTTAMTIVEHMLLFFLLHGFTDHNDAPGDAAADRSCPPSPTPVPHSAKWNRNDRR